MHEPTQTILVWPAAGIGMIVALVWGIRILPGLYLAHLCISIMLYFNADQIFTLQALKTTHLFLAVSLFRCYFGAFLIKYFIGYPNSLISFGTIVKLFLFVAPLATFISTIAFDSLKFWLGYSDTLILSSTFLNWWFGDLVGFIIFAPFTMIFISQPKSIWKPRLTTVGLPISIIFIVVILIYNQAHINDTQRKTSSLSIQNKLLVTEINQHNIWIDQFINNLKPLLISEQTAGQQLNNFLSSETNANTGANAYVWKIDKSLNFINASNKLNNKELNTLKNYNFNKLIAQTTTTLNKLSTTQYNQETNQFFNIYTLNDSNKNTIHIILFHNIIDNLKYFLGELNLSQLNISVQLANQEAIKLISDNGQLPKNITTIKSTIKFFDENWNLSLIPTINFFQENYSSFSAIIAKIGFIFTGLIGIMLLIITGKTTLTNIQVKERTLDLDTQTTNLRKRKKQYQELIEQHPVILWRQHIKSNKMSYISDKVESLYGYPLEQWLNEDNFWINHIHINDQDRVKKIIQSSLKNNNAFELEYRLVKSDLSVAWVKDVINVNKDHNLDLQLVGLMIDVTETQEAKVEQSISESKYQTLFKHAVDPLIIINLDDNSFRESNDKAIDLFGLDNIRGHVTLADFSPIKQPDGGNSLKGLRKIFRNLNTNKYINFEWWMLDKAHKDIICEIELVKLPGNEDQIAMLNINDITESKLHEKKINQLAYYDNLTKLPNREYFYSKFEHFEKSARSNKMFGAIIYLDLDRFKILNDSLGHQAGDELLKIVAQRIRKATTKSDFCARLGGDEFIILTKKFENTLDLALETNLVKSELILEALNEPYQLGDYEHLITPSIGISVFPSGDTTIDQIIHQADIAMYASKEKGKNTITIYQESMIELVGERLIIEKAIRQAFSNDEFLLYYQPQINQDNKIVSVEALLRWKRSAEFNINTEELIKIIEKIGLTHDLGFWVFDNACAQLEVWQNQGHSIKSVAINVSASQFHQKLFTEQIMSVVQSYNLNPSQIIIELTEAVIIEDMVALINKLNELKEYGIRTSLDDFGTGYSSLAYLKHLPIDQLKIDKMFIHDLSFDKSSQHIVKTIIDLASAMDINLIAEGIEIEEQFNILKELGCKNFQGFYFSKAVPANQLA